MNMVRVYQVCTLRIAAMLEAPLTALERRIYADVTHADRRYPVFIVGSPRSGSTILYQALTATVSCLYVDNISYPFLRNIRFGIWLSAKVRGRSAHKDFDSRYGVTRKFRSPSECPGLWHKWFPVGRDHVEPHEVSEDAKANAKSTITSIISMYDQNIVFKVLSLGQKIPLLRSIFPDARFIYLRRDPMQVIESLLKARHRLGIAEETWWSVKPENYRELSTMAYPEKIVAQVFLAEKRIHDDIKSMPDPSKAIVVDYHEMSSRLSDLQQFVGGGLRADAVSGQRMFSHSKQQELAIQLEKGVLDAIAKYDWKSIGYDIT